MRSTGRGSRRYAHGILSFISPVEIIEYFGYTNRIMYYLFYRRVMQNCPAMSWIS